MSQADLVRDVNLEEKSKDEKLDNVFWFKFFLSILAGLACGILNLTGFFTFVIYFVGSVAISFFYFGKFVESEEVDYQSEVFIEGLNVSIPSFLLFWIISYTMNKFLILEGAEISEL